MGTSFFIVNDSKQSIFRTERRTMRLYIVLCLTLTIASLVIDGAPVARKPYIPQGLGNGYQKPTKKPTGWGTNGPSKKTWVGPKGGEPIPRGAPGTPLWHILGSTKRRN